MSGPQSERYAERGPKGDKGAKGEEGALPARARRSLLIRDVVIIVLLLLNFLFTAHYVNSTQAAQRQQGLAVQRSICSTLDHLAALKPPAGNPETNPSRAFDDNLHATLDGLGPDLGCRR